MMDLSPFCATEKTEPGRPYLYTAFNRDAYTYATDGRILVRVPLRDGLPAARDGLMEKLLAICEARWAGGDFVPLPEFETIRKPGKPCTDCGGMGRLKTCPECKGECETECCECGNTRTCPDCKGMGGIQVADVGQSDRNCVGCDGTGAETKPRDIARFAAHDFDLSYVERIIALPGLEVCFGQDGGLVAFRFHGGEGALMPTHTRDYRPEPTEGKAA
jgi:hypothetical protein